MSNVEITISVPEDLIERAQAVGVQIETEQIIALLESQIKRREAGQRLYNVAEQLRALLPDMKPTPDEIEAEIQAYRAEKRHNVK